MAETETTIMFHGTSSARLASIMESGLELPAEDSDGIRLTTPKHEEHLRSLIGVYLAASSSSCESYADSAVKILDGDQVLVTVVVDPKDTIPDEDVVLEFLGNCITDLEIDEASEEHFLGKWRRDEEMRDSVAAFMSNSFRHWTDPEVVGDDKAAFREFLEFAFAPMSEQDFDECHEEVGQTLWPHFLKAALFEEAGVARYRDLMDRICKCYRAPEAYDDIEYHSIRVPVAVGTEGRTRIVGIGTFDDPFAFFSNIDEEAAGLLEEADIDLPEAAPAP